MPATPLVNKIVVMGEPLQIVCEAGVAIAFGIGLTVIVPVAVIVPQPPVSVTV